MAAGSRRSDAGTGDDGLDDPCARVRAAVSARADGEDAGLSPAAVADHLAGCAECRAFAGGVERQRGALRLRPAEVVPDLSERILAVIPSGPAPGLRAGGRPRRRGRVAAILTAVAALVGAAVVVGHGLIERSTGSAVVIVSGGGPASPFPGAAPLPAGIVKPSVRLTDTADRSYDVATATAGQVTLVYFGYTRCPDVCPINMALAAAAIRGLSPAEQIRVTTVFVTTDPAHDTTTAIRAWLDQFDPRFVGLTGSLAQIQQAETEVDMPLSYASGTRIVHAGYTLVYGTDGVAAAAVDSSATVAEFSATLKKLLAGAQAPSA